MNQETVDEKEEELPVDALFIPQSFYALQGAAAQSHIANHSNTPTSNGNSTPLSQLPAPGLSIFSPSRAPALPVPCT